MVSVANLHRPTDAEREAVGRLVDIVPRAGDFPGYLDVLRDPANSPLTRMQVEQQGATTARATQRQTEKRSGRGIAAVGSACRCCLRFTRITPRNT